ncbi:MAG: O-antigen ligase family protein [Saprospiraceae bacterium]|nr:O-antigen ligase family protein [Saprospiraceae bacterium]
MQNAELSISKPSKWLFYSFSVITLLSIFIAAISEFYYTLALPAFFLLVYFTIVDFRTIFFILLAFIPLSTEIFLPNGFGTDLPTEPFIVGLMMVYLLFVSRHSERMEAGFFRHPITTLLYLHFGWILITTVTSSLFFISFKYLLAKFWYIITFYFLAGMLVRKERDVRQVFWFIFIPLMITVFYSLAKHSVYGFSFESVFRVLHPFYRNHVAYAAILATFVPFLWFARQWYPIFGFKWLLLAGSLLIVLIAIQLSYTRAAYVAIFIAIGAYYMIRFKLMKYALAAGTIIAIALATYLTVNNRYLEFAPNYEQTITHTDFNNLLEATYQLEDISTMERVFRWVAAGYMSKEKPIFGFGPGNFYSFYWPYTVSSFETYVSDNPERSGIHSYYLMVLVEQGYVGLVIYLALLFYILIRGEQIYHRMQSIRKKQIVMIALLMIIIISALQLINDLLETDKIGPFFFMSMAILVNMDVESKKSV